jgi:hypothetical protein
MEQCPATILSEMNRYFDKVFGNLEELSLKDGIDLGFQCPLYHPQR